MKNNTYIILLFLLLLNINITYAQNDLSSSQEDNNISSTEKKLPLSLQSFLDYIKVSHPILRQADLAPKMAQAEKLSAHGAFDPVLDVHFNRKNLWNYKENWSPATYYESNQYFFKVPAWIGDAKFGFERYVGININPENFTPPQGLAYVELSFPLARGLFWDERRATLRQAEFLVQQNAAERQKIINKLIFTATKDYWQWYEAEQKLDIQRQSIALAEERFNAVKERVVVGDLPAIDSIEARLETEKRRLSFQESEMIVRTTRLQLATHLWDANLQPIELADNVIPIATFNDNNISNSDLDLILTQTKQEELLTSALNFHPEGLKLKAKIKSLEIEQKFRKQELLPVIDIDYKPFFLPPTSDKKIAISPNYLSSNYLSQNYKFGINIYVPIFLRKERGKFEKAKLKTLEANYELTYTMRSIVNDLSASFQNVKSYTSMLTIQQRNVEDAKKLRDAEIERFKNGESSLFLINSRERSSLSEQEKRIEIMIKLWKSYAEMYYSAGLSIEEVLK